MGNAFLGRALLGLFVVSGFAGLIYQSIWSHYLGLVLGHAAYAQTLVLGIFMGGMALGAWQASRLGAHWRHLILAYAAVELVIGLVGLVFHPLFVQYLRISHESVLPALDSPVLAHGYTWLTGALIILPQSVLLGMTFPLLSSGYLRLAPRQAGEVLGGLYFTNSVGAALGALVTAFWLLPAVGMPGAVMTAGVLNILVAMGAWLVWKTAPASSDDTIPQASSYRDEADVPGGSLPRLARVVMIAAFITGATSFVYEIGWVRLLNQSLGTTIHSFELMLAAFIFGLACGGWWVRRRAAAMEDTVRYAAYAQILMGLAALVSVVVFAQSFRWVGWLLQALNRTDQGYTLFSGGSAAVALLVMFPAAFFAGMTLPLFTTALLRAGGGEEQIGRVYAFNTLGAIVGVLLMVHVLVPMMGVRLSIILSGLIDAGLGLYLLRRVSPGYQTPGYAVAGVATLAVAALTLVLGKHDPRVMASGVFRSGTARLDDRLEVPYLRDGKTATVAVVGSNGAYDIATNGKIDAALVLDINRPPNPDEITMVMAGALPLALHPAPREIAVIGWGSGLTTHTLLGGAEPEQVDTIEIERAMVDGASLFGDRVARAYQDPRSQLHIDDARTYFATGHRQYDVIVSEPSNPWVSGVASLFTREFYRFLEGHLNDDGMLVQWVQAYELDEQLLATMQAALLEVFPNADVYVTNTTDLLIVAYAGKRHAPDWTALQRSPLREELKRVGLGSPEEFAMRRIGSARVLRNFVAMQGATPHSDFFPVVALNAPRSRFKQASAISLLDLVDGGLPVSEMLDDRVEPGRTAVARTEGSRFANTKYRATAIVAMLRGDAYVQEWFGGETGAMRAAQSLRWLSRGPVEQTDVNSWTRAVAQLAQLSANQLPPAELEGAWIHPTWISQEGQPAVVQDVLRAMQAAASRDRAALGATAEAVLAHPGDQLSAEMRERMLLQAQLGALVQGRSEHALALQSQHGRSVPITRKNAFLHAFLLSWARAEASTTGTAP